MLRLPNTPCQANCSHWFCGNCIMLVWHHGSALQPCNCPRCHRQLTLLVPTEASLSQRNTPEVARLKRIITISEVNPEDLSRRIVVSLKSRGKKWLEGCVQDSWEK
ncbi:PREDICTED: E3 ubiquitin-protein ligase RNF170-like [Fragaria vesca subsp. vesca]|uniref:E3 ubiquitin-protein ligase RNF170-like n=1 Tax=Fragaria vesca subsp. vesca TaxID=101020 RepID=UPI0002C2EC63|nr:PREDICTED: E3 ubiquitin-protein ligase RNF170-like [Fragaria vesca subsp. vesca]